MDSSNVSKKSPIELGDEGISVGSAAQTQSPTGVLGHFPPINNPVNIDAGGDALAPGDTSVDGISFAASNSNRPTNDIEAFLSNWDYNLNPLRAYYNASRRCGEFFSPFTDTLLAGLAFVRKTAMVGFLVLIVLLVFLSTNVFCALAPSSTCAWTKELSALTAVEIDRVGGLVNSTRYGTGRAMEIISVRRAVEELRMAGFSSLPEELDGELLKYFNSLLSVSRRLMRVDASIWALAESVIVLNEATHKHLERSSTQSLWSRFWWYYCKDPSFDTTSRAFSHLRDALAGAVDASLREAIALRSEAQRLSQITARSRRMTSDFLGKKRSRGESLEADILAFLWDEVVPWRWPVDYVANVRRPLATAHISLQKSNDYLDAIYKDLQQTKQQIQLIDDLASHSSWTFRLGSGACPAYWDGDRPIVFKDLVIAADEIRHLLRWRL